MKNCNGHCIVGGIVAILFASLFLWTLVIAYQTQLGSLWNYNVLPWYIIAFVFLAIAKWGKCYAYECPHCQADNGKSMKK